MPKYIDADALSNFANNQVGGITANHIMRFPTADVEPVRHGRWIEHPDDIFPLESTIECSVCGEQENVNIHNDNFCPNCGAKMDKEEK